MADLGNRVSFAQYSGAAFVGRYVEKQLFGSKFVRRSQLMAAGHILFDTGGLLGRRFADQLDNFVVPFTGLPSADGVGLLLGAGQSVARVESAASNMTELFYMHEMRLSDPDKPTRSWSSWVADAAKEKMSTDVAATRGFFYSLQGAGFAAQWPDRWEALDRAMFDLIDDPQWRKFISEGYAIQPDSAGYVSLESRQHAAAQGFAAFCKDYWPEYLRPLGLA